MSDEIKAKDSDEIADKDMEEVSGGVSVGSFRVRGRGGSAGLAKVSTDGVTAEFVPKKLSI